LVGSQCTSFKSTFEPAADCSSKQKLDGKNMKTKIKVCLIFFVLKSISCFAARTGYVSYEFKRFFFACGLLFLKDKQCRMQATLNQIKV
jgi:hypothetical protein